jgi:3-dehydroquinate dehydratase-1
VVGSISLPETLGRFSDIPIAAQCDIVEFRLDAYPDAIPPVLDAITHNPVKSLAAARDPKEGGVNALGFSPRRALLAAVTPHVDLIDVELRNFVLFRDVIDQALENNVLVVASYHNFEGMPSSDQCAELIHQAAEAGASAAKLAVTLGSGADLARLISLFEASHPVPLSLMGMGPLGQVSRIVLGHLGSCLNYGYLDQATVSGQWSAMELKRLLEALREAPAG